MTNVVEFANHIAPNSSWHGRLSSYLHASSKQELGTHPKLPWQVVTCLSTES